MVSISMTLLPGRDARTDPVRHPLPDIHYCCLLSQVSLVSHRNLAQSCGVTIQILHYAHSQQNLKFYIRYDTNLQRC